MKSFLFVFTRSFAFIAIAFLLPVLNSCSDDPTGPGSTPAPAKGKIQGKLLQKENSLPVEAATIVLTPSGKSTTTTANGSFSFSELTAGTYSIGIDAGDFGNGTVNGFIVTGGQTTTANINISFPIGTWSLTVNYGVVTRNYTLDYYNDLTYEVRGSGIHQFGTWSVRNNVIRMESTNSNDSWTGDYDTELMTGTVAYNAGTASWTAIR